MVIPAIDTTRLIPETLFPAETLFPEPTIIIVTALARRRSEDCYVQLYSRLARFGNAYG